MANKHNSEQSAKFDTVGFIMDWESGELSEEDTIAGFQQLVDNGLAWSLQGAYGRQAEALIKAGLVTDTHGALAHMGRA